MTEMAGTPRDMHREIDDCVTCHTVCEETISHCLQNSGTHADPRRMRMLMDCADITRMCSDMMMRGSEMAGQMAAMCAMICDMCAEDCARMSDDAQMMRCAEACRRCAESCRAMSGGAQGMSTPSTAQRSMM